MSLFSHTAERRKESSLLSDDFLGVVLFCGIGLTVSLFAVICGIQGAWF